MAEHVDMKAMFEAKMGFSADDVPLDETNVAKLDAWFDQTVVGELMNYSEEKARAREEREPPQSSRRLAETCCPQ